MATIQELAEQMHSALERKERPDKNHDPGLSNYVSLKDGSPHWMRNVAMRAHDGMRPDDWRYEFIEDAVAAIAEGKDQGDCEEALHEYIYTAELTGWLHSHLHRPSYADEAMAEYGGDICDEIATILGLGMAKEQREVLALVLEALRKLADGEEDIAA